METGIQVILLPISGTFAIVLRSARVVNLKIFDFYAKALYDGALPKRSPQATSFLMEAVMTMATQTKGTGEIHPEQVEDLDGIAVLRGGGSARGWNGIQYQQGL